MLRCWNCTKATGIVGRPARSDDCPHCRAELRCCRGCRFFAPQLSSQCSENSAEPPIDKEKANFCDFFVAAEIEPPPSKPGWDIKTKGKTNIENAKNALDKLFGK